MLSPGYVARRILHALIVLAVVAVVTFFIVRLAPGGPAALADPALRDAERAAIEARLGLNDALPVQFLKFVSNAVRGDLGQSFLYGTPTTQVIASRIGNTLILAGAALTLTLLVAIPLGTISGLRPRSWLDRVVSFISVVLLAIPVFWLGLILIIALAVLRPLLPAGGMYTTGMEGNLPDLLRHLLLPAVVLASASIAELLRYTRSSVRSAAKLDHVRTARAKGLPQHTVHVRHVLKNALIPVVTVIGLQLPRLVGGAAVTETIFAWPGMGRLSVEAALGRDYPLILGVTLVVAAAVVLFNLLVDLVYPLIDPRIRTDS
ncbi:ABC transporter permease [Deinococcus sp.]|uniref:ABC transporter permease n=1 Tax=Deinococcus sp. TaxID=47478 RepID=UPI002869AA8A|nr:ABC transporter permease [Deinococcus sp.]